METQSKNPRITHKEIEVIKEAQAGSMPAFNKLYERYKEFVENVIYCYVIDKDETNYLANEVFLKVYEKLSTFTAYDSFGGWLRIIAKNTAIDYLRQKDNNVITIDKESDRLSLEESIGSDEVDIVDRMTYEQLIAEFEKLPDTIRTVCKLFYQDNLTIEEISNKLNSPIGTVKSQLSRTRAKLKKTFKNL